MKIDIVTELIFSQAVSLSQNGKMKSIIHCGEEEIFIQNMDNTILLRFQSPQKFVESFSFYANDYESSLMEVKERKIAFVSTSGSWKKIKTCAAPKTTRAEILKVWKDHKPNKEYPFHLNKEICSFLEENLSHIEIEKRRGKLKLVQRDIYSGSRIEIQANDAKEFLLDMNETKFSFDPIGIRTVDFMALFSLVDSMVFYFQPEKNWLYFESQETIMDGILSTCLYDELGYIAEE